MKQIPYKDAVVTIEPKSRFDLYQRIIDVVPPSSEPIIRQATDEASFFRNQPIEATTAFERNRKKVEQSLVKLVAFLWDHYKLPRDGIVEYGSGATSYFYAVLRPKDVRNWLQVEINSNAIAENLRRNPAAQIIKGSYYNIPYREVPMITGLSSFDTASDVPRAIDQVSQALAEGGFFLHIQDVRPGLNCVTTHFQKTHGLVPEYVLAHQGAVMGFMADVRRLTLVDIFREAIGDGIRNHPDLDLIVNDYHTLSERLSMPVYESYFLNLHLIDTKPLDTGGMRNTTILVTIAKKKPSLNQTPHPPSQ